MDVYVLWYARQMTTGLWKGTNIGYYSSLAKLEEARERLRQRPGFRDYPQGLVINCYRMDEEYDDPMFFTCWGPGRRPAPVLGETIGVDTPERPFEVLLWRNTQLPASYACLLPTGADNQPVAQVKLVAGDPASEGKARRLGELVVPDLPPRPRSSVRVPIWVAVDERGAVSIAARHPQSGEVLSVAAGMVAVDAGGADPGAAPDPGRGS
jgi:Hsp70 protein